MSNPTPPPNESGPFVKIHEEIEDYAFGKLFRIIRAKLQYRLSSGRMSQPVTRINFERGDSVGVLLHDPKEDTVILVRQFRYPVYTGLTPDEQTSEKAEQAWILEMVAGIKEPDQTVKEVAQRELFEEAGYSVKGELKELTTIYPSPGGTSERITLFLGEADHRDRISQGGGIAAEGEDIQVVVIPFQKAMQMITRGEIRDAKTIIALQHLALTRTGQIPPP